MIDKKDLMIVILGAVVTFLFLSVPKAQEKTYESKAWNMVITNGQYITINDTGSVCIYTYPPHGIFVLSHKDLPYGKGCQ